MDVKDYVKVYDNVVGIKQVSHLIKWLNTQEFRVAEVGHGLDREVRSAHEYWLMKTGDSLTNAHWFNFLGRKFIDLVRLYEKNFKERTHVNAITEIVALKYTEGDYYKVHSDNSHLMHRTLSIILFLNDDYKGGKVTFKCPKTYKNIFDVPPKSGRVIIFPSNFIFPHVVENIDEGLRYTIVSWIR